MWGGRIAVEGRAGHSDRPAVGRLRHALTPVAVADLAAILPTRPGFPYPESLIGLRLLRLTRVSPALATVDIVSSTSAG